MSAGVSVVVPARDTRELTLAALASVAAWGESVERIVVDDASTDATAEVVSAQFPGTRVLRNESPAGFARSANRGIAAASGAIVVLVNSDAEVDPEGRAAIQAAFDGDARLGAAGATLRFPDGRSQWSGGREPSLAWLIALASGGAERLGEHGWYRRMRPVSGARGGDVDWVPGAAMALSAAALREVGVFDEGFRFYAQDLDLCCRLRRAGWAVRILPEFGARHHLGATVARLGGDGETRRLDWLIADLRRWAERWRGRSWTKIAFGGVAAGLAWRRIATRSRRIAPS